MKLDTSLSIDCGFVRFLTGQRFDRTSFFKAVYELSRLTDDRKYSHYELKTYTYTGRIFLYENEPYHYTINVENASGYLEYHQESVTLIYLMQILNFSTDKESCVEEFTIFAH